MSSLLVATAALWGTLVFVNYLSVHGLFGELTVPLVYLAQWRHAWPGAAPALAAMTRHAGAAAVAFAVLVACLTPGRAFLRWASGRGARGGLDSAALGAGALALAVFGLGLAGLLQLPVLAVLVAAGLPGGARQAAAIARRALQAPRPGGWVALLMALIAVLLCLDAAAAIAPEWFFDALLYHLAVPQRILLEHRFVLLEGQGQFSFPLNTEMLFTVAMALGGETAAKLLNLGLWLLALAAIHRLARTVSPGPLAGPLAVAIFLAQPMLAWETESAFDESLWVLWIALAAEYAIAATPDLAMVAAYAGLAAGAKYIGLVQAVPLAIVALARARWRAPRAMQPACAAFLVGAVLAAPWYLKNFLFQTDPVFPMLAPFGISLHFPSEKFSRFIAEVDTYGLPIRTHPWLLLLTPWDFTQHDLAGGYWQETSGPLLLALAPLAVLPLLTSASGAGRPIARRAAVLAITWALIWAWTNRMNRLLLPALVPGCALLAAGVACLPAPRARRAVIAACAGWVAWSVLLRIDHRTAIDNLYRLNDAVTGKLGRAAWEEINMPTGSILPELRGLSPARSKVLLVCEQVGYGIPGRYVSESIVSQPLLERLVTECWSIVDLRRRLRQHGITHLAISHREAQKAGDWGQYTSLGGRAEGLLSSFFWSLETPTPRGALIRLYALPEPPKAARTR